MKTLKLLFFLPAILLSSVAYSQSAGAGPMVGDRIKAYNAWLELTGLSRLVTAVAIKDTLIAPKDQSAAHVVKMLVIRNSDVYPDAKVLAHDWQVVKKSFDDKGFSVYSILLLKFAFLLDLSPDSTRVVIRSGKPKIFSVEISFHDKLEFTEHQLSVKDPGHSFSFDIDHAMDHLMHGYFRTQGEIGPLKVFLQKELRAFFNKHNHKDKIEVHEQDYGLYNFKLKATHIYRHITQRNYHEIVYIDVAISPLSGNQIEVRYFADAVYNSGILSAPADETTYRNISKDFPHEIHNYDQALSEYFNKVIYQEYERGVR